MGCYLVLGSEVAVKTALASRDLRRGQRHRGHTFPILEYHVNLDALESWRIHRRQRARPWEYPVWSLAWTWLVLTQKRSSGVSQGSPPDITTVLHPVKLNLLHRAIHLTEHIF